MLLTDRAARRIKSDSELLSMELLEEHARRLAAMLSLSPRRRGQRRTHLRQLKAHMQALREDLHPSRRGRAPRADAAGRRVAAR